MGQLVRVRQYVNNSHRSKITWNSTRLLNTEWISSFEERGNLKSDSGEKSMDLKETCFVMGTFPNPCHGPMGVHRHSH